MKSSSKDVQNDRTPQGFQLENVLKEIQEVELKLLETLHKKGNTITTFELFETTQSILKLKAKIKGN